MTRKRMAAAWTLAVVALVLVGCPKKTPPPVEPPPAPVVESPPAEPVQPPPAPPTQDDPREFIDAELADIQAQIAERGLMVLDVYFDYDKYDLKPEARQGLQKNAAFMRENDYLVFAIEGHCDERGTNEYYLALGERRANVARDYLTSLGINGGSMRTVSYGEERPNCMEHHEGCWQQNRRAHFVVVGKR